MTTFFFFLVFKTANRGFLFWGSGGQLGTNGSLCCWTVQLCNVPSANSALPLCSSWYGPKYQVLCGGTLMNTALYLPTSICTPLFLSVAGVCVLNQSLTSCRVSTEEAQAVNKPQHLCLFRVSLWWSNAQPDRNTRISCWNHRKCCEIYNIEVRRRLVLYYFIYIILLYYYYCNYITTLVTTISSLYSEVWTFTRVNIFSTNHWINRIIV